MTLRQRVELHSNLHCALNLQNAHRLRVTNKTIRVVVDNQDIVLSTELDQLLEQLRRRSLTRRHIGIVHQHHLDALQTCRLDSLEIGQETGLLVQRIGNHHTTRQLNCRAISGITGIGNQHLVAHIEEGLADVHQTLFRAKQRQYLRLEIYIDIVVALVPISERLTQDRLALIRHIFVNIGTLCLLSQTVDNRLMGRQVGTTHSQTNDLTTRSRLNFADFAQLTREIVLADTVQTM